VLVTGGAGYIGSHTCLELLTQGYDVTVVDNLDGGHALAMRRVAELAQRSARLIVLDVRDRAAMLRVLAEHGPFGAVIHFAGKKAVAESVSHPLLYYDHNVGGTLSLLQALITSPSRRLVFSSSATVYGEPVSLPLAESARLHPTNPYGHSKLACEQLLQCAAPAHALEVVLLRYFNPVGAHGSGRIGESPQHALNLLPLACQVACGQRPVLDVFGTDWPTADGTCIRDYLHVVDLARAHVAALNAPVAAGCCEVYNLGTGRGYSVLEMVAALRRVSGRELPLRLSPRRAGDVAVVVADPSRARQALGWQAAHGLEEMVASAWHWTVANPDGYGPDPVEPTQC
jgi:UDP-glucose 4-epimerase